MAKDGTNRGGARVGAGKRSKENQKKVLPIGLGELPDLQGADMPPVKKFMTEKQQNGKPLGADAIYAEMCKWIKEQGCSSLINPQMIEQYSMTAARWIQCENAISEFGLLAKHPTTGAPIQTPFFIMRESCMKQLNQLWYQIYALVKEYGTGAANEKTEDTMEMLLRAK